MTFVYGQDRNDICLLAGHMHASETSMCGQDSCILARQLYMGRICFSRRGCSLVEDMARHNKVQHGEGCSSCEAQNGGRVQVK